MWFSVVCTLIDNDIRHYSGTKFVVGSLGCASLVHYILTTVMTNIVVDKSTAGVQTTLNHIRFVKFRLEVEPT